MQLSTQTVSESILDIMQQRDFDELFSIETDYAIQMHIDKNNIVKDAYGSEFSKRDFRLQNRNFMTILKGFSSSAPFFYPALKKRFHNVPIKGGGIFLKWKGYGLVIDPGISFMENMHIAGLNINDINAIFVTHNHINHNGDLSAIIDSLNVDCFIFRFSAVIVLSIILTLIGVIELPDVAYDIALSLN